MDFKPNPLLYGANEDFFSTFRLAIRMRDIVDYDLLSRSVEKAMARYPYFCVFPKREGEKLVLRYNNRPLPVFSDDRAVTLGSEESGGHLIPDVGLSSILIQRIKVDLPVPEGPITEMTSPLCISTFTSLSGTAVGYSFLKCSIRIIWS